MLFHIKFSPKILIQAILILFAMAWLFPLVAAVSQSLKIQGLQNYWEVLNYPKINLLRVISNSFVIAVVTSVVVGLLVSLASFSFSKMEFKGKYILYYMLLACLSIPPAAIMTPMFILVKKFGLMNSLSAVILPVIALQAPFMLLILKNYFDTIPSALIEAARIDGCSSLRVFYSIILPLAIPALVTIMMLTFINAWNEYLIPLLFIKSTSNYPVTLAATYFTGGGGIHQTPKMLAQQYAALIMMTIPSIIIYIFCQKYLQAGLTAGALKS